MAGVLRQPDPEIVTPRKAAAVLRHLGLDWAAQPGYVPTPHPPGGAPHPRNPRDWWVGEHAIVTWHGPPETFPTAPQWSCDRDPRSEGRCWEVAAAILVHCWNRPDLRPLFDAPSWSLDLLDLMQPAAPDAPPDRRRGWIRYHLQDRDPADTLPIDRTIIRLSRRDATPLKPRAMPDELAEVEAHITGVTEADRIIHDVLTALHALRRPPITLTTDQVEATRARLRARGFAALCTVADLWYEDAPLAVDPHPFLPVLRADDTDDGIALRWRDPVTATWTAGPGYVITGEGALRPLAPTHLSRDPDLLTTALPTVPIADAATFVDRFVLTSGIAMDLHSAHLPPTIEPDALAGRLRLDEIDDTLRIQIAIDYRLDDTTLTIDPARHTPQERLDHRLLRRDPLAERALIEQAEAALGQPLPAMLGEDAALSVLLDGIPALSQDWIIEGTDRLRRFRVAGRLSPRVSIPSGIDWLDLRIEFTVGDHAIPAAAVLDSWREGRQFHRLPDGSLARLPDAWLSRHGARSDEIETLRAAAGGRLHAHAAPLVNDLLAEAHGETTRWARIKARLDAFDTIPDRPPPAHLKAELRTYQKTGYRWLCWLRDLGLGGVLADDMGLGKTVQALALLLDTHDRPGPPSLVIAPTSVIYNWAEEAARFTPDLRIYVHHGPTRPANPPDDVDIVITSYALLRADEAAFDRPWRVLILDEAQRIKNPRSNVARAARNLNADHRFALTGTPLENHLVELWSIFECLMPGFFGSRTAFQRRYALPIERDRDEAALTALRIRLRPFVLRRLKSEVATELPPRQEQILYCELGPAQRRLYERVKATYREAVLQRVDQVGMARATLPVLEALMRLRQACCDPALLPFPEAREIDESAKLDLLMETLEETIEENHRSLVFSQWTSLLKRVAPLLEARGWSYLYLDGSTRDRHGLVKRWNDPDGPPVFLVSLKAGGAGLNLTGADHVIHLDPWWNPAVEDQATDRAHRIGQTRPVVAYKLVARDTVEEKVLALQARKRALFDAAVDQGRFGVEQLSREDIEAVLHSDDPGARPLGAPEDPEEFEAYAALLGARLDTAFVDDFDPSFGADEDPLDLTLRPDPRPARPVPSDASMPLVPSKPFVPSSSSMASMASMASSPAMASSIADNPDVLMQPGERLTNARVRDVMGWSAEQARTWLRSQVEAGALVKRGRKRGTWYEPADGPPSER